MHIFGFVKLFPNLNFVHMNKFQIISSLAVMTVLCSFILQPKPWDVPAEFKMMKNPVKKTDKVLIEGKMHYNQACTGCHGLKGKGDGEKVKNLANIRNRWRIFL